MVVAEKREGGRDHKFGNSLPLRHQSFTFSRSQIFFTFQLKLQSTFIRASFLDSMSCQTPEMNIAVKRTYLTCKYINTAVVKDAYRP